MATATTITPNEIREEFRLHRQSCAICDRGVNLCPEGLKFGTRLEELASRPSVDARYVAGRIIMHMWIIFVMLPMVLAALVLLLK